VTSKAIIEIGKDKMKEEPELEGLAGKMMANLKKNLKAKLQSDFDADLEKKLGMRMNSEYAKLCGDLKLFAEDMNEYDALLDFTESRILDFSRVVKKEVIDMSDLMEKMALIMLN
jgi:hypothetical protein